MIELQSIFREHGDAYRATRNITAVQSKAMNAILTCRTAELGAHIDRCDECGFEKISYNSCRNRHCPKCQTFAKEDWIDRQKQNLIDCQYFHTVFTVPADLRPVFMQNQEKLYKIFFKAASLTLLELCADRKYLGAKPGITIILHTWSQNLCYHPHLLGQYIHSYFLFRSSMPIAIPSENSSFIKSHALSHISQLLI